MAGVGTSGLIQFLQTELNSLVSEAKRKHPEIKEVSDNLLATLKSLASASHDQISSTLAKSQNTIVPFILSCDSKNPKLVPIAIGCLQRLVTANAVLNTSIHSIFRAIADHVAGADEKLQLKILQTVLPAMMHYKGIHGDVVAEGLVICFRLQESKFPVVSGTAGATLRQLVVHIFDKVVTEDKMVDEKGADFGSEEERTSGVLLPCVADAHILFQDLCEILNGNPSTYLKVDTMTRNLGLELVDSILMSHWKLFTTHLDLQGLLKDRLCPILLRYFSEKGDFAVTVRVVRVMFVVLKNFNSILPMECEIFLSMFVKLVDPDSSAIPLWRRVVVMEALKNLCASEGFIQSIFSSYDKRDESSKMFAEMVTGMSKIVVADRPALFLGSAGGLATLAESPAVGSPATADGKELIGSLTVQGASMKVSCIEQLDKTDPPPIPELYVIYLSVQCVAHIAEKQASFIIPIMSTEQLTSATVASPAINNQAIIDDGAKKSDEILVAIEMANASYSPLLASLSLLISSHLTDDEIHNQAVSALQGFTNVLGLLGLVSHRSAFLETLCRIAIPAATSLSVDTTSALREMSNISPGTATMAAGTPGLFFSRHNGLSGGPNVVGGAAFGIPTLSVSAPSSAVSMNPPSFAGGLSGGNLSNMSNHLTMLGDRNVSCLRALMACAVSLTPVLDDNAWFFILETLQAAEMLVASGAVIKDLGRSRAPSLITGQQHGGNASTHLAVSTASQSVGDKAGNASGLDNQYLAAVGLMRKLFDGTKTMEYKSLKEFVTALCRLAVESNVSANVSHGAPSSSSAATGSMMNLAAVGPAGGSTGGSKSADEKPFAIIRLCEVIITNTNRLIQGPVFDIWNMAVSTFIEIAHCPAGACSVAVRNQACSAFGELIVAATQAADLKLVLPPTENQVEEISIELTILSPLRRFMLVESGYAVPAAGPALAADAYSDSKPRVVRGPWFIDVQKSGLETLKKILQSNGRGLSRGWGLIFEVIRSVVVGGSGSKARIAAGSISAGSSDKGSNLTGGVLSMPIGEGGMLAPNSVTGSGAPESGTAATKAAAHVKAAFSVLELVCADFLSLLSPLMLLESIETLGCFGSQPDDVNISLTAIQHLWSVSDTVRNQIEKFSKSGEVGSGEVNDADSLPRRSHASRTEEVVKAILEGLGPNETSKAMDILWMHVLAHLSQLCSDPRPDVRISANQTLFRTIGSNGKRLTLNGWDECIWNVLFPLLERVKISSERVELIGRLTGATAGEGTSSSPPLPQKSKNAKNQVSKQWDDTKIHTLTGVTTCITTFFPVLVDLGDNFDRAWSLFHEYIRTWCLEGSADVAKAAVKSLKTLVRYTKSEDGTSVKLDPKIESKALALWKVSWDTWEAIGLGIVAGADENANMESISPELSRMGSIEAMKVVSGVGNRLLHGNFQQETLALLVNLFGDIHDVIHESFGLYELKRLLAVLGLLVLYHTNPTPGALSWQLKLESVSDLDNVTPLQEAVLNIVTETRVSFEGLKGAPEAIMWAVSGFIRLPFVRLKIVTGSAQLLAKTQPSASTEKGYTYMALAKRSLQHLVTLFEKYGSLSSVYSGGTFETVLSALDVPMRAKYDCPAPGTKDSTPIWRCAANTAVTIVELGLKYLDVFVASMPHEILSSIYYKILDLFDGFLLPSSSPPSTLSTDELAVDTDFDISVFETIQTDVISHLGQAHVSDDLILGLVKIIFRCSKLYTSHVESGNSNSNRRLSISNTNLTSSHSVFSPTATPMQQTDVSGASGSKPSSRRGSRAGRSESVGVPSSVGGKKAGRAAGEDDTGRASSRNSLSMRPEAAVLEAGRILGVDVVPLGREKFAKHCLEVLLSLCADEPADNPEIKHRVATIAAPFFLEKVQDVITRYCDDRPLYGRLPFPRIRSEEICLILSKIKDIRFRKGILENEISKDKIHPLRSHVLAGESAHLFMLYPQLCNLMAVMAKSRKSAGSGVGGEIDESALVDIVKDCLKRVGIEMGIDI